MGFGDGISNLMVPDVQGCRPANGLIADTTLGNDFLACHVFLRRSQAQRIFPLVVLGVQASPQLWQRSTSGVKVERRRVQCLGMFRHTVCPVLGSMTIISLAS